MSAARLTLTLAIIASLAAAAACGRRADLDTPYEAAAQAREDAIKARQPSVPPEPEKPVEDKPFVLDPLL